MRTAHNIGLSVRYDTPGDVSRRRSKRKKRVLVGRFFSHNSRGNTGVSSRRLQCRNSKVFKPDVAVVRSFVSDINMEDGDDAGSHLPAVDDLSNDETEGSGSSEESDVFDVRRREDEPWSESA